VRLNPAVTPGVGASGKRWSVPRLPAWVPAGFALLAPPTPRPHPGRAGRT
jgi:hypothetical protein